MTDNDLKYRYIKSMTGINPEDLAKLEDIFQIHRDKNFIKELRGNVENYERELKERADKIERDEIKNPRIFQQDESAYK